MAKTNKTNKTRLDIKDNYISDDKVYGEIMSYVAIHAKNLECLQGSYDIKKSYIETIAKLQDKLSDLDIIAQSIIKGGVK